MATTPKLINIFPNANKRSMALCEDLSKKLKRHNFVLSYEYNPTAELNICIGGDGAFLRAVHNTNFSPIPFVGINTGHLGFYQEINSDGIDKFIDYYKKSEYVVDRLMTLSCTAHLKDGRKLSTHSLNEFLIRSVRTHAVHFDVYLDKTHLETFAGDGLILSTPSGFTAYNLSAGGSILYQTLDGFQMTPLAPINSKVYRSLISSLVMPSKSIVRIYPIRRLNPHLLVVCDGIVNRYNHLDHLEISVSASTVQRLVFKQDWYWSNIKDKFL